MATAGTGLGFYCADAMSGNNLPAMTFYIVGASSFGRETLDALCAFSEPKAGQVAFLDDGAGYTTVDGVPVRPIDAAESGEFVVAIADAGVRQRLASRLCGRGLTPGQVIHPRAFVSPRATVGPGCIVFANTFVSNRTVLGSHVHVFHNATIAHDSVLGDYVTVLPGVNIAGAVTVGPRVTFGTNSCVLQGLRIGADTMVGAGAAVIRDQPAGVVIAGVPTRVLH